MHSAARRVIHALAVLPYIRLFPPVAPASLPHALECKFFVNFTNARPVELRSVVDGVISRRPLNHSANDVGWEKGWRLFARYLKMPSLAASSVPAGLFTASSRITTRVASYIAAPSIA